MTTFGRRRFIATTGSLTALSALTPLARALAQAAPALPVARVEPVTEVFFGQSVTDPYRWMENGTDPDWEPYVKGQADHARRVFDAIPGRDALVRRIEALSGNAEIISNLQKAGPFVFIEKRPAGADNFRLYVREGASGRERLLINPEVRKQGDVSYAISYWAASPDGKHVVYGMSASGSERAVIEVLETRTGRVLPERIDRAPYASASWLEDGSGFFFNRLAEGAKEGTDNFYKDSVCWLHRLGSDPSKDVQVLLRGKFGDVPILDIDFPSVAVQPGSPYVVGIMTSGVRREVTLFTNSLAAARRGDGGWKPVCTTDDQVVSFAMRGNDLWLLTEKDAPRGRIVQVTGDKPAFAGAREVVPHGATVKRNVIAARDAIYVQSLDGGIGAVERFGGRQGARGDATLRRVALPFDGALSLVIADPREDGAFVALVSWVRPTEIVQIGATGSKDTGWTNKPNIDVSPFTSERVFATAKDGVRVPVSIVYRKGTPRDGTAPTMVDAYGAYAISSDPYFAARAIAWMEQGGVWATAHVRGGGEYGREWHEAGRLLTKPNTWRDLIAACEYLIAERWTSAGKLSIRGGSAGGITVGRAMTERPDLFSAVFSQVGVSNALRAEFSQNGPPNIPEFGTVKDASGFKALYEMDALVHVKDGVKYPAVVLTTGLTDPRVNPWNATKMAARLQAASTSGKPVLLRVDYQAGHGIGSTRAQRDAETADVYAFALWQAGVPGFQPKT